MRSIVSELELCEKETKLMFWKVPIARQILISTFKRNIF